MVEGAGSGRAMACLTAYLQDNNINVVMFDLFYQYIVNFPQIGYQFKYYFTWTFNYH